MSFAPQDKSRHRKANQEGSCLKPAKQAAEELNR
jgi:hypothetical protein